MGSTITYVIGCTGSGKGGLGRELARRLGGEIISVDSMKVYRRMNIGTAKPDAAKRGEIPHHLIDVVEPSDDFSVAQYVALADCAIAEIGDRQRPIFVVGGTPFYIKALSEGLFDGPGANPEVRERLHAIDRSEGRGALYQRLIDADPVAAQRIHRNDLRRIVRALEVFELTGTPISALQTQWNKEHPRHESLFLGLRRDLADQNGRTNERVKRMIDDGLVEEVRRLVAESERLSTAASQALGYAEIIRHLSGELTLADAIEMIKINTRQFAKAQRTWFKRFRQTVWVDLDANSQAVDVADSLLARKDMPWSSRPK